MGCGFESHRAYVNHAFLYAGVRTPFGRYAGSLAGSRPDDLAATVVKGLLDRAPEVDPTQIADVILGCANGAGEDNRNVGRMAVLLAGLPVSVPGLTVNRLCGSSLQAAMDASRLVETGDAAIVVAGGVESMSRAPWVLPKPARAYPAGNETLVSTTLGWRLVNSRMPDEWTVSLGECNEQLADVLGIGRERQDACAVASHRRAAQAWSDGFYDDLVLPVDGLARDECVRPDASVETLAALKPAFRPDGTITAGNASPAQRRRGRSPDRRRGRRPPDSPPLARIAGPWHAPRWSRSGSGSRRSRPPSARWHAAGIGWSDVGAVELNEAFAVQSLACLDAWKIDPAIVNTRGGAIAIGHPSAPPALACSARSPRC